MNDNWQERYLLLAKHISGWSKDPSSQIGAVIVDDNRRILSTGYNGFPSGINDSNERLNKRETKYKYIVHAEMNAIYNATQHGISLKGSYLFVYGLPVCSECAKGVIQVGIQHIVCMTDKLDERWIKSWNQSMTMFDEAGLTYELNPLLI